MYHAMKIYPVLNEAQCHEGLWETSGILHALEGGEWSTRRIGGFTSGERAPGTRRIGDCVGLRAVLDAVVNTKRI